MGSNKGKGRGSALKPNSMTNNAFFNLPYGEVKQRRDKRYRPISQQRNVNANMGMTLSYEMHKHEQDGSKATTVRSSQY